ncbi:MAG: hypothetical protein NTV22_13130 [bacterium]|nr:hypothetical protein [bacterium]
MHALPTRTLILLGLLASCLVLYAINEAVSHTPTGDRITAAQARILAGTPDLTLKSSKGTFKYKDGNINDAQQSCVVFGQCPTAYTRFDQFNVIHLEALCVAYGIDVDQPAFYDPTGVGKDGTTYRKKFFWPVRAKLSGGPGLPMLGMFKGKIKKGILSFTYMIKKANEMDLLITNDFDQLYQDVSTTNKAIKGEFSLQGALTVGAETHTTSQDYKYNFKKKGASGGMLK